MNRGDEQVVKWSAWVKADMAEHPGLWETPPTGIRTIARAMSRAETGSAEHEGRFVGIASETCRRIREETPAAERLALTGGQRVDRSVKGKQLGVESAMPRGEEGEHEH